MRRLSAQTYFSYCLLATAIAITKRRPFVGMFLFPAYMAGAQSANPIAGPLGVYHVSPGYTYADSTGTDTILLEDEIPFGKMAISNQASDYGFEFVPDVDSCHAWNANRI